ncbi:hypothetical protein N9M41_04625 [Rhodopirellula sp.]|nr:hypothetical protein [Rhodopirellula sp.]
MDTDSVRYRYLCWVLRIHSVSVSWSPDGFNDLLSFLRYRILAEKVRTAPVG